MPRVDRPHALTLPPKPQSALQVFAPLKSIPPDRVGNVMEYWVEVQRQEQPDVRAVFDALTERIPAEKPTTVRALVDLALDVAQETVPKGARWATLGSAQSHYTTMMALAALAGHAYTSDKLSTVKSFPKYISAGGEDMDGRDKARHVVNQALLSYLARFDEHFDSGDMANLLHVGVTAMDPHGIADAIGRAYEAVKGRAVGLLPGTTIAPVEEGTIPFFERPQDLSSDEARAYDTVVRMGDIYEDASTKHKDSARAGYDVASLGKHPEWEDPLARVDHTANMFHGLADRGVTRDLTADRVGAYLGLQLFRDPSSVPPIAFDDGPAWKNQPFAPGPRGTLTQYFDAEARLWSKLDGGPTTGATRESLLLRMHALVDDLAATDRDTLSKLYANFAVRQLAYNVPFGEGPGESPDFDTHQEFARTASPEALKAALTRRVSLIEEAFVLKRLNATLSDRVLFDPSFVRTGAAVPFAGGALLDGMTAEGPARWAALLDGRSFFIAPAITQVFDTPGNHRLGLPVSESVRAQDGTWSQAFSGGTLTAP